MTQFTDEQLTAYLDGEAEPELEEALADAVEADARLADRLAALDVPLTRLREGYDALLEQAPALDLPAPAPEPPRYLRTGGLIAAGLAAGVVLTLLLTPRSGPDWTEVVASYQSLYSTQTLEGVLPASTTADAHLASLGQEIGLSLDTLPPLDGLTFRRAQLLAFEGTPLVQIVYTRADGTPIALCILPSREGTEPLREARMSGLGSLHWTTKHHGFLLIGGAEVDDTLREAAAQVQNWSL